MPSVETREIDVGLIDPDTQQPRKIFLDIERLAADIKKHGLLSPILVRPSINGRFTVTHGERRLRAVLLLGWKTIRAEIKAMPESEVRDVQLAENLERNDLSAVELAWEFQRRIDQGQTHRQIAATVNKDHTYVTQRLSLLNLPKEIMDKILRQEWTFSQAREFISIKDESIKKEIAERVTSQTTTLEMRNMIKAKQGVSLVTHVTTTEEEILEVQNLAVYRLLMTRKAVTKVEFLAAIGEDLDTFRGSVQ